LQSHKIRHSSVHHACYSQFMEYCSFIQSIHHIHYHLMYNTIIIHKHNHHSQTQSSVKTNHHNQFYIHSIIQADLYITFVQYNIHHHLTQSSVNHQPYNTIIRQSSATHNTIISQSSAAQHNHQSQHTNHHTSQRIPHSFNPMSRVQSSLCPSSSLHRT
jgi:hypothetical protein